MQGVLGGRNCPPSLPWHWPLGPEGTEEEGWHVLPLVTISPQLGYYQGGVSPHSTPYLGCALRTSHMT